MAGRPWGAFCCPLLLTGLLQFFMSFTMALLAFWLLEVSTFIFMVFAFEYIAGGHLFPLEYFAAGLARVLSYTPFPYQLYFPVGIYLGQVKGADLWQGLLIQSGWVLFFFVLARVRLEPRHSQILRSGRLNGMNSNPPISCKARRHAAIYGRCGAIPSCAR